jgi:drug/metabolite transporter (DMT)-like permease
MTFRRYMVLAAVAIGSAVGDLFLKLGMDQVQTISLANLGRAVSAVFNPWVALGVVFLTIFFASYLAALSWADLSFVLPATSFGYVLIALLSVLVLHEHISGARWLGIAFITCGVGFVSHGPSRTVREPQTQTRHADYETLAGGKP